MVDDLLNPKMPWRELLNMNLISTFKTDYSFMRPNRKGWHMPAIMPGMTPGQEVNVVVAVDTSGSIGSSDIKIFLSEINGIMESFDSYNIHVFSFDTRSYNPQNFTSDNLADISEYEPEGGGGTDFNAIFDYLKEEGIEPQRLVVFTDGYPFGSWGDENYCDTTWIIHGDPKPNPPFGTWAVYDDHRT
jgi:predicted metal-dependent peptidase